MLILYDIAYQRRLFIHTEKVPERLSPGSNNARSVCGRLRTLSLSHDVARRVYAMTANHMNYRFLDFGVLVGASVHDFPMFERSVKAGDNFIE